jgi:flagellar basal-body rod modification protein FlgD
MMSQMAQFSTLEQLQNMNASLDSSLQWDLLFNQTINNTMATSLIGREVEAAGDEMLLGPEGEAAIRYELSSFAHQVRFEVVDASGQVVFSDTRSSVDAGMHEWNWDGRDVSGARVPAGYYHVRIEAQDVQGAAVASQSYRVGTVDGVAYEEGNAYLIVNGQRIALGDVQRISMVANDAPSQPSDSPVGWFGRPTTPISRAQAENS